MTSQTAVRHVLPARLGEPRFDSPLRLDSEPGRGRGRFVPDSARVRHAVEVDSDAPVTRNCCSRRPARGGGFSSTRPAPAWRSSPAVDFAPASTASFARCISSSTSTTA